MMTAPTPSGGRIKGVAIRAFVEWYARQAESSRLHEIARTLPAKDRDVFDLEHPSLGVLPSVWFPASVVHYVLDGLTTGLSEQEMAQLVRGAAQANVDSLLRGVQRILFTKLLTPGTYARVANLAFRANYDSGWVKNEHLSPRRHRGTVHDWVAHHPFLCRMNVEVKLALYRHMRCTNPRIERRFCRREGDDDCGSVIAWD